MVGIATHHLEPSNLQNGEILLAFTKTSKFTEDKFCSHLQKRAKFNEEKVGKRSPGSQCCALMAACRRPAWRVVRNGGGPPCSSKCRRSRACSTDFTIGRLTQSVPLVSATPFHRLPHTLSSTTSCWRCLRQLWPPTRCCTTGHTFVTATPRSRPPSTNAIATTRSTSTTPITPNASCATPRNCTRRMMPCSGTPRMPLPNSNKHHTREIPDT